MAGFFDKVIDVATAPITSVANTLKGAWDDYSGKTATEMSINAAKQNTAQQISWEREKATHAHQWEVEDLEKAGLNPILSAGGSGAATGGISPQMPDISQYKGAGAIVPIMSNLFDNVLKISNSSKAKAEADLATEGIFTQRTNQILNMYQTGLISQQTAGQAIRNEIDNINKKFLPWEKSVGIAKDVATSVMPFMLFKGGIKRLGTSATQITNKLDKLEKTINNPWRKMGDGKKVNMLTGEIKNGMKKMTLYDKNGWKIK